MSKRKLATIRKISKLSPIEGADRIEVAEMENLGWMCVVKKGEFKVGDWCCYIEIDSLVPPVEYFKFMTERKYRVKTIRLRKTISQGLVISIDAVIEILGDKAKKYLAKGIGYDLLLQEGLDITEELGIKQYQSKSDQEANEGTPRKRHNWFIRYMSRYQWFRALFHVKSKSFPEWISKTDEERCISEGTLIYTDRGLIKIEELIKNPQYYLVLSYNEKLNKNEFKKIIEVSVKPNRNNWLKIITTTNKQLIITKDHKVYIPDIKKYVETQELKRNFNLLEI